MISEDQLGYLGYDGVGGRTWMTMGAAVTTLLVVEAHAAASVFGSGGQDGGLLELGGGARLDVVTPMQRVRLSPAAHLNLGLTGDQVRPTLSVEAAILIDLSGGWSLGPNFQYGQVFQPDQEGNSSDARYVTVGLAAGYRPTESRAAKRVSPAGAVRVSSAKHVEHHGPRAPAAPETTAEPSAELLVLIESAMAPLLDESTLLPPVLFLHDSSEFIPCGEASLFYVRDAINERRGGVLVEGHADTSGDDGYNLDLAQRRAEVVRDWLITHGVASARLQVKSRGESTTLTPDSDASRRQINRRVVIHFGDEP